MKLLLTIIACFFVAVAGRGAVFTNTPSDKDAFVRAAAPASNYGGGGALSVSGTNAANPSGTKNGAFDSFMSFNTAAMVANFNSAFGAGNWAVTSATLNLTQNPAPGNAVFNIGTGSFQVFWMANDTWSEGTGTPMTPTMDGVTYAQESTYLDPNTDQALGTFYFPNNNVSCSLTLPTAFVNNMEGGGEVGFFLTAADPDIGFVFYSHNFKGNPIVLPQLVVTAAAQPVISSIRLSGANIILSANNGVAGGTYYVLASSDLSLSFSQWTPIATNVLSASGNFAITLTNATSASPQYFVLKTQ